MTVADETEAPSFDDCSFAVQGLKLSGAVCRYNDNYKKFPKKKLDKEIEQKDFFFKIDIS